MTNPMNEKAKSTQRWTGAQNAAIEFSGKGLLLSAGAGSGKTATLTEKVCRMVCDEDFGTPISRMIIVTFTRAAAGELRERIANKLSKRIAEAPSPFLVKQLIDLESAEISTIHSFFMRAVKPHFSLLGLPPNFKIADESAIRVLKQRIMADTVDFFFDSRDEEFVALADTLGSSRSEDCINEKLLEIADKMAAKGLGSDTMAKWAKDLETDGDKDFFASPHGKLLYTDTLEFAEHYLTVYGYYEEKFSAEPDTAKGYGATLDSDFSFIRTLRRLLKEGAYEDVRTHLSDYTAERLSRVKNPTSVSLNFKEMRDDFKKQLGKISEKYVSDEASISEVQKKSGMLCRAASKILAEYFASFENEKRERGIVDYGDLEIYADKIFCAPDGTPTEAALEFSKRFDCIFIDEYQDTNRIQDRVFAALSSGMKRFMVGDVKQSIYAFRGSEPSVFTAYREIWPSLSPEVEEFSEDTEATLFMNENFRSDSTITDFVNLVSSYMFIGSSTPFEEGDKLKFSRIRNSEDYRETKTEVCLVEKPSKKDDASDEEEPSPETECPEAEYVADRISAMINGETLGSGELIRPSHVTVLLRSTTNAHKFVNALKKRGIPVKDTATSEFFEQSEVLLVLCILNAIDNPLRDVYLAGAMKSPVFGFSMTDMVKLIEFRNKNTAAPLWYCIEEYLEKGSDRDLLERCARFCDFISKFRLKAPGMSASRLLSELYDSLSLYSMTDGNNAVETVSRRIRTNLTRLYEYARQFDDGAYGGLHGFILYLCELMEGTVTAEDTGNDGDAVTVMNIHKSKGLQFPVCFLCECAKKFNTKDTAADVLFDPEIGLAMKLQDPSGLVKCETPLRGALAEKIKSDNVYEEMRVLYVAMTRAEERLIVTMSFTDCEKQIEKAIEKGRFPSVYGKKKATSYADFILPAVMSAEADENYFVMKTVTADCSEADKIIENGISSDTEKNCTELSEILSERLSFRYKKSHLSKIPAKVTVSKLRPSLLDEEEPLYDIDSFIFTNDTAEKENDTWTYAIMGNLEESDENVSAISPTVTEKLSAGTPCPAFLSGRKKAAATDIGTATHVFLQFADFEALRTKGAEAELERLREKRFITDDMASLVDLGQINAFLDSSLFEELEKSSDLLREFRFNVALPASDFTKNDELSALLERDGINLTVQGVVDLVFVSEKGEIILVDYKTDRLTAEEINDKALAEEKLRERHTAQLTYYKLALEKMYGRPVSKVAVYSLPLGDTVDIL
ncbi:MAG: hypothetical protein E7660_04990 [Ruminococcaceae bacterium]|nr:hypothetical protein [Oscillospiraceae bacterium]